MSKLKYGPKGQTKEFIKARALLCNSRSEFQKNILVHIEDLKKWDGMKIFVLIWIF